MFRQTPVWIAGLILALAGVAIVWTLPRSPAGWAGVGLTVAGCALVWRAIL